MSSKAYDIVLLPEPEIAAKAIRASQELKPLGTHFSLGPDACLPHVSLYMLQIKDENLPAVFEKLADIASQTNHLALKAQGYVQAEGYIDADYQIGPEITALQQAILDAINPFRDGLRPSDQARIQTATGLIRENIEKYGYRSVGELFRPHLTITRFTNSDPIPLEDMIAPTAYNGEFATLAICELGDHGTCAKKIEGFDLP